jgi:hypothetical protein
VLKQNKNITDLIVKSYGSFDNFEKEVYERIDRTQTGGSRFIRGAEDAFSGLKRRLSNSKPVRAIKEYKEKATNKLKDKGSIKFTLLGLDFFIFVQNKLDNKYKYLTLMLDERGNLVFCASEHMDQLYDSQNRLTLSSLISSKQLVINQASKNAEEIMDRLFEEEQSLITQEKSSSQPASPPTEPTPSSSESAPTSGPPVETLNASTIDQQQAIDNIRSIMENDPETKKNKCQMECMVKHKGDHFQKEKRTRKCIEKCA